MLLKRYCILATTFVLAANTCLASQVTLDSANSKAEFLAIGHPSMINVKGSPVGVTGSLKQEAAVTNGSFQINLNDFKTGIETRDHHMKERYLETGKTENQVALLTLESIDLPAGFFTKDNSRKSAAFHGQLKLHGVSKPTSGSSDIEVRAGAMSGSASFKVKLSDFSIPAPSFAGATIEDEVSVNVHLEGKIQ